MLQKLTPFVFKRVAKKFVDVESCKVRNICSKKLNYETVGRRTNRFPGKLKLLWNQKVSSKCSLSDELPRVTFGTNFLFSADEEKEKRTIFPCCVLASEPTLTFGRNLEVYFGKSRLLFWISPFETNSTFFTVNLVHVCPKTPDGSRVLRSQR